MTLTVILPDGPFTFTGSGRDQATPGPPFRTRVAYAAVHVVADPMADNGPGAPAVLDWEATLRFRHHLWAHGFGVAEAMDTAQRGMGLDYAMARELIRRCATEARAVGGRVLAGVGTDQLPPGPAALGAVRDAYAEQLADVSVAGAVPVIMCSRQLAAAASSADQYLELYTGLIDQCDRPVVLHWLGAAFDPALAGYWGDAEVEKAAGTLLTLIARQPGRIDGVKLSLLDAAFEVRFRRQLPAGVRMYTGDDLNYPALVKGDADGYSDALLGVFAAIAPVAAAALRALDAGDTAAYDGLFAPTVTLARHMFGAPTYYYKTGIVFLAYLAGHQDHVTMVGGLQAGRSARHLAGLVRLADAAGLLPDAELAAYRARAWLTTVGVPQ